MVDIKKSSETELNDIQSKIRANTIIKSQCDFILVILSKLVA